MNDALSREDNITHRSSRQVVYDLFVPLLLVVVAVALWFGFQAVQLFKERAALNDTLAAQEKTIQEAKKLRNSLDAVARETALLADKGNQNAKIIVDELKKRGITINPNATPDRAPAPSK